PWNVDGKGGSCRAIAFIGKQQELVLAATWWAGVLRLDTSRSPAAWQPPDPRAGLEPRDLGRLAPVESVVSDPARDYVMAGGSWGIRRSANRGETYDNPTQPDFEQQVTIPQTWVLVNGQNELNVTTDA